MKRELYRSLVAWKHSDRRKPLILRGARQTGKTYLLKEFATNEYENYVYVNFEEQSGMSAALKEDIGVERIVEYLGILAGQAIVPGETLIIFDEIQSSPQTLRALKYFNEKLNEYHIVAAGSLLGIALAGAKSFPVGKVNFLDLYPLSFSEFLTALNKESLLAILPDIRLSVKPIPDVFHAELLELLKKYFFIGGLPEVVADYVEHRDIKRVREIQVELLRSYANDFAKHSSPAEALKIKQIWDSIPLHLSKENRKFVFSAVKHSARAREYETALQWLQDAGLIIKVQRISKPLLPLNAYTEKAFKVYLFDVGLLGAMTRLKPETVVFSNELFTHFKGALVENYAMQQLGPVFDLYYWASSGKAEVDLVVQAGDEIHPIEIKAGVNLRAKSLKNYDDKFSPKRLVRCSLVNFSTSGTLIDIPLYALDCLVEL
jgi:predicted AAA+ superfamily ATPase